MRELKYDVRRGADTYSAVYHSRLKSWILKGIIKREETLVWRSGLSGWRRPEELEELKPFFSKRENERLKRRRTEKAPAPFAKKKIERILIIDDEEDLCWLLAGALNKKGYDVKTMHNLKDGVFALKHQPDLIFLDLKLPDGDGMDILHAIQSKTPDTVVVIISAYGSEERMVDAKEKGVHGFINKPFTEEKILQTIRQFQENGGQTHG